MTNLLITIVIGIGIALVAGYSALSLFQSARDNFDQQMLMMRLEQAGIAVKSKIKIIDGLPTLPMADTSTAVYPTIPSWITSNNKDLNGNYFAYCPYALRPTSNLEGTSTTVVGSSGSLPNYAVVTYGSTLMDSSSHNYVIGSDKPTFYSTNPAATLTPSATSGYSITFTAGSSVFSASDIGKTLANSSTGVGTAVITGYTSGTVVTATITSAFANTSAIASGNWSLGASAPKGLLGYIIAFKAKDTYSSVAAQNWCNSSYPISITTAGKFSTHSSLSPSGIIYPIIASQSQYQQAAAKQDLVTLYVATTATGDGTGRNPANATTLDAAMAQLAALQPMRAKIWMTTGTHIYNGGYENNNSISDQTVTLTPGAVVGTDVTFTAGSGTPFAGDATDLGKIIRAGSAQAIVTDYSSTTVVKATITSAFYSTGAIGTGVWGLITPVTTRPSSTLTPSATTGTAVTFTAGTAGTFSSSDVGKTIVGNKGVAVITGYTDATHVVGTVTTTFNSTAAIASGSWALTKTTNNYAPGNPRGIQYDFEGVGAGTVFALCADLELPVNVILRNMTGAHTNAANCSGKAHYIRIGPGTKWIANNVTTLKNVIVSNGELWVNGTTSFINGGNGPYGWIPITVTDGGRVVMNGTVTTSTCNGIQLQPGRIDVLPGATWTITKICNPAAPEAGIVVYAGGTLSNSGTLSFTTATGVNLGLAMNVAAGGQVFMNNATTNFDRFSSSETIAADGTGGSCPGLITSCKCPGVICNAGEVYLNASSLLFPNTAAAAAATSSSTAAVALVDGGKFYMHNGSAIGDSSVTTKRPYWGIYDNGGTFVGGSTTGYSSGANGEGGGARSYIYAQSTGKCWDGNLLPDSSRNVSGYQNYYTVRHLFLDSALYSGTPTSYVSTPQGHNSPTDQDYRHLIMSNQSDWACSGPASDTTPNSFGFNTNSSWCGASGDASPWTGTFTFTGSPTRAMLSGFNSGATISVSGTGSPQYSLDGGTTWTSASGTMYPYQSVMFRVTPSTTNSGSVTGTLTVGGTSGSLTVTTGSACYVPTVVYLTTGTTTWTVPAGWNNSNNTIEVLGPGGKALGGSAGGGGGGGYAKATNYTLTAGNTVNVQIGAGGSGNATYFNTSGTLQGSAGGNSTTTAGGTGGSGSGTSAGVTRTGGNGGSGSVGLYGGGGGAAAGPNGNGGSGANGSGGAGGGGGGANGGTSGSGLTGGTGASSGGNGGGVPSTNGSAGTTWDGTHGPGGGGGGSSSAAAGGNGGSYGGGVGGGSAGNTNAGNGLIIITYQ